MASETCDVLVIGGGPAGLRAAELVSAQGWRTVLADRMPSVGRKFLVAGRGGLNLTHSEPLMEFQKRYGEPQNRWRDLLAGFTPDDLRAWAKDLGVDTFIGTSRRVFPASKQAAPLLRRWIERLRRQGVRFQPHHRLTGFPVAKGDRWQVPFAGPNGPVSVATRAAVFALGGASWPQTGSDGTWFSFFEQAKIPLVPLAAANVGYEVDWPAAFLAAAEGLPLKNINVRAGEESVSGELLITKYGLEGGALYQLGRALRGMDRPSLTVDLKPAFTEDQLRKKLGYSPSLAQAARAWKLSPAARHLLGSIPSTGDLSALAKHLPITLRGPRPLAEAISTTGGVAWEALDDDLMLTSHPGLFCAGEMIAWDAPTGGYLLQGCFATGTRAARGVAKFLPAGQSR